MGLGFDAGAGACRSDPRRAAAQSGDVREPQRLLLSARSRDRTIDSRDAVYRHQLGEGDWRRWAPAAAARQHSQRSGHARLSGSERRDQLDVAVIRSGGERAVRHRPRFVRRVLYVEGRLRAGRRFPRRRRLARERRAPCGAARHRRPHRQAVVGVSLYHPVMGGRAVDRLGPRLCRVQRQLHGL